MISSTASPWRARLHSRLRAQPYPLLVTQERILHAALLWSSARVWVDALRAAGVGAGDRIVLAADAGAAFVPVLVAGLWEQLSMAVVQSGARDPQADLTHFDARLLIGPANAHHAAAPHCSDAGLPMNSLHPRSAAGERTPDCRLLLRTSGTSGDGRWIALSDRNLLAVLDSHAQAGPREARCMLSVLPWHHAFGLILDLLAGLLAGAEILRIAPGAGDPDRLLRLAQGHPVAHLNAVPITLERLRQSERGETLLRALSGGLVGGAAISAGLADFLCQTRLRVGYGQTEASPGICLGEPGEFCAGWLGRPLGCSVRVDEDGVLAFAGPNAALGEWTDAGLVVLDPERWVRSGDLACASEDGFLFQGRLADCFKMTNGRFLSAALLESQILALHPGMHLCMVGTVDGTWLELAIPNDHVDRLNQQALKVLLGQFGISGFRLHPVSPDRWVRSPKGDLNRRHAPWL